MIYVDRRSTGHALLFAQGGHLRAPRIERRSAPRFALGQGGRMGDRSNGGFDRRLVESVFANPASPDNGRTRRRVPRSAGPS